MALNVSIQSDGRIGPKAGAFVLIPPQNAGIGDLVFKNSGGDVRVYGRGTVNASTHDGYTLYGCIYGFVNGQTMIIAPFEKGGKTWGSDIGPAFGWGAIRMRNGFGSNHVYATMNIARTYDLRSNFSGSALHPTSGWADGGMMGYDQFAASTPATTLYGSGVAGYKNYLAQTLRVNGVPGTCFGATAEDSTYGKVKVHEFGKYMMGLAVAAGISNFPAFEACYNHEGNTNWWLPSMFELGELMIDEHLDRVNENALSGVFDGVSNSSDRWSCVRYVSGHAWSYDYTGLSYYTGFGYAFAVRPVTLLKLV